MTPVKAPSRLVRWSVAVISRSRCVWAPPITTSGLTIGLKKLASGALTFVAPNGSFSLEFEQLLYDLKRPFADWARFFATPWLPIAVASACMGRRSTSGPVVSGQKLGLKEVEDGIRLVSLLHYDLGYIDSEQRILQTIDNPLGTMLAPEFPG